MSTAGPVSAVLVTRGDALRLERRLVAADGCLEFAGARNEAGYGLINIGGRSTLAHRVAWQVAFGVIPSGLCVLHSCDNPPCCNPAHLFLGTRRENNRDAWAKGRGSAPPRNDLRGERNPAAKLSAAAVVEMRRRAGSGEPVTVLARAFGVSHSLASMVVARKRWNHV